MEGFLAQTDRDTDSPRPRGKRWHVSTEFHFRVLVNWLTCIWWRCLTREASHHSQDSLRVSTGEKQHVRVSLSFRRLRAQVAAVRCNDTTGHLAKKREEEMYRNRSQCMGDPDHVANVHGGQEKSISRGVTRRTFHHARRH